MTHILLKKVRGLKFYTQFGTYNYNIVDDGTLDVKDLLCYNKMTR